jgi:hypothetical protein
VSVSRICEHCEQSFPVRASRVAQGRGRFCSRQCSDEGRRVAPVHVLETRVDRSGGPEACWLWTGRNVSSDGYGRITRRGKPVNAHRIAWEQANGSILPKGKVVRHLCPGGGNPLCCNPRHLTLGTKKDNADDMVNAGRQASGENNGKSKLTSRQVSEIVRRCQAGESRASLARAFGVSEHAIFSIATGRTWGHLAVVGRPS